jgi:soluble lytic murein transglycosylase-like protein
VHPRELASFVVGSFGVARCCRSAGTVFGSIAKGAASGHTFVLAFVLVLSSAPGLAASSQQRPLRALVERHAHANGLPVALAHAIIRLESGYRTRIVHKGNYGLMQIRLGTARAMGFRGSARQLLHPDTNLRYGMRYLGRAWRASGRNICGTIKRYQTGTGAGRMQRATLRYCARAKRLMARR